MQSERLLCKTENLSTLYVKAIQFFSGMRVREQLIRTPAVRVLPSKELGLPKEVINICDTPSAVSLHCSPSRPKEHSDILVESLTCAFLHEGKYQQLAMVVVES